MDPIARTPTEPRDYAALNLVFLAGLGALAAGARGRDPSAAIPLAEIPVLGAATFALSKALVREKVTSWAREPFVEERDGGERRPRGSGLRFAIGELLTCTRCAGSWGALGLVALRVRSPAAGRVASAVLAANATSDILQTVFAAQRERANLAAQARPLASVPWPSTPVHTTS